MTWYFDTQPRGAHEGWNFRLGFKKYIELIYGKAENDKNLNDLKQIRDKNSLQAGQNGGLFNTGPGKLSCILLLKV